MQFGLIWGPAAASAFDPVYEAKNYSKTLERARIYMTPSYQLQLRRQSLENSNQAALDPDGDGNMFSRYYRSRLDIGLVGGGRFDCEGIRPDPMRPVPPSTPHQSCSGFTPRFADGWPGEYDYLAIATSPDSKPP